MFATTGFGILQLLLLLAISCGGALSQTTCPLLEVPSGPSAPWYVKTWERSPVGKVITFLCPLGGYLVGSPAIECLPSGHWNDSAPYCAITCPLLFLLAADMNLRPGSVARSPVGTTIFLSCYSGWELEGVANVTCQADGTWNWNDTMSSCVQTGCPPLHFIQSDIHLNPISVARSPVGTTVVLSCDSGWKLKGVANVKCQADRTWNWNDTMSSCDHSVLGAVVGGAIGAMVLFWGGIGLVIVIVIFRKKGNEHRYIRIPTEDASSVDTAVVQTP